MIDDVIALGLPAFPCLASKAPACPGGFKAATEGTAGISALWRRYPGPLVGVPTGPASGFDVLDVDRAGGSEWYAANKSRLPGTRIHRTRGGGLHLLFLAAPCMKCSAGKIAPGVDVRAAGGYIIWWPSAGLGFRDYPPEGVPDWPAWLLKAMAPAPYVPCRQSHGSLNGIPGVIRVVLEARDGERNRALFWAACRHAEMARDGLISAAFAVELLVEAGMRRGLTRIETLATVRSAFSGRARHG